MRNPYITGAYVTGKHFYGRSDMLDYLLHGPSRAYWVVGNRRIGKTSLLRQLALLASAEGGLVPLYWDMQGCDSFDCLGNYLADAVGDAGELAEHLGPWPPAAGGEDAVALLTRLRRAALAADRELLLLCDETEALLGIAAREPEALRRLHRELTGASGLRVVMTSTRAIYQFHDICRDWPTSPFLAGFDMSQTLGSLEPDDARALIVQAQSETPVDVPAEVAEAISAYTNNHPYLLQLLCSRLFEPEGRLRPVQEADLEVDPLLAGFFAVDFGLLTEADRRIVSKLAEARQRGQDTLPISGHAGDRGPANQDSLLAVVGEPLPQLRRRVHHLEILGYLRREDGQVALGNQFLANWLASEGDALRDLPAGQTSERAMGKALAEQQAQEVRFLVARLNAKRARLVELEAIRARDLLAVSPQVLSEIARLQADIQQLRRLVDEIQP